jgi:hypothetical protein
VRTASSAAINGGGGAAVALSDGGQAWAVACSASGGRRHRGEGRRGRDGGQWRGLNSSVGTADHRKKILGKLGTRTEKDLERFELNDENGFENYF